MALSKDDILNANDASIETLEVPQWGGDVNLRVLRGFERDKFEARMAKDEKFENVRAYLASMVIVDDNGERLFNSKDVDDLGNKSASALSTVFNKALEMNGFTEDEAEKLEKN